MTESGISLKVLGMKRMKSKKELLKSSVRAWNDTDKTYDAILIVPSGKKHESGFMHIAVIGVTYRDGEEEFEIIGEPDDIACVFPTRKLKGRLGKTYEFAEVRMDCYYPQGILRYHGDGLFHAGPALSTLEIYFTPEGKGSEA